jgi:hypothetical protein
MRLPGETGPIAEALLSREETSRRLVSATLVSSQHVAVRWEPITADDLKSQIAHKK